MDEQIVIDGVACTTIKRFTDRRARRGSGARRPTPQVYGAVVYTMTDPADLAAFRRDAERQRRVSRMLVHLALACRIAPAGHA